MFKAGAYLRLSKDDGDKEVSDSIENQKTLISGFVKERGDMALVDFYIDDGFGGLNFERPAFKRMMEDVSAGVLDTIITKDMSRLGREHIETSNYIERVFPLQNVRYIAILDGYDSLTGSNAEIAPFKALINDMYAKDISKKVRGAFRAKASRGEFIGAFAPFGYRKHPLNNDLLIIDDYAAAVVKRIFDLYMKGTPKLAIARLLNAEGEPSPSEYKRLQGLRYRNSGAEETGRGWTYSTINKILHNEVYTGCMAQRKSETISYKLGKKRSVAKEDWIVVGNTHEGIIDRETFDRARSLLAGRSRALGGGVVSVYAGLLKCGDCGRAMSRSVGRSGAVSRTVYYKCGSYKEFGKSSCASHTIREDILSGIVLRVIREEALKSPEYANMEALTVFPEAAGGKPADSESGEALRRRLSKIDGYLARSYEDYADGLLSRESFKLLNDKYSNEKRETRRLMEMEISRRRELEESAGRDVESLRFASLTGALEVTREMLAELVEYIKIYEDKRLEIMLRFAQLLV